MPKLKAAAIVTIRDGDKMTPAGRRSVAAWLRKHAKDLIKHGKDYGPTMHGRYLYQEGAYGRRSQP